MKFLIPMDHKSF